MDLSGKLIKGTGSYEVKEISLDQGNQIFNGNFETGDLSGWSTSQAEGTITIATDAQSGSYSVRLQRTSGNTAILIKLYILTTPVKLGSRYKFSFWVKSETGIAPLWSLYDVGTSTYYQNYVDAGIGESEWTRVEFEFTAKSTAIRPQFASYGDFTLGSVLYDNVILEEIQQLPTLDKGTKYPECTSAGTVAIPSDIAYGEGQFKVYKGGASNLTRFIPIASVPKIFSDSSQNGYLFQIDNAETIQMYRITNGSVVALFATSLAYVDIDTWYDIKWKRTLDGEFIWYIKGGDFGISDWTVIVASSGSNPVTDNNHTESQYFVLDFDAGDRMANLEIRNLVKQ